MNEYEAMAQLKQMPYAIVAMKESDKVRWEAGESPIYHACLYDAPPTESDIRHLNAELKQDPEFGLMNETLFLVALNPEQTYDLKKTMGIL